jgi:hypothetical protein
MKSRYQILLRVSVISAIEMIWSSSQAADPQTTVDAGIDFAKSMTNDVIKLGTDGDAKTVPGFGGTNLPQTEYYKNQDLNSLQTDAMVGINTGTANDASQFAYQKSLEPKLLFNQDDPILTNAKEIGTKALENPSVLTVPAGACESVDVATDEIRYETCTSWLQPTQQTCNKTLDVNVTWDSISSCPIATSFNQEQALHNSSGADDYVYARAYCNPGSGDDFVDLQLNASDGDPDDCTGWTGIVVSVDQPNQVYTGALLKPAFDSSGCELVPTFIKGGCVDNQCDYDVTYHELSHWRAQGGGDAAICYGTPMDLAALGYTGPGGTFSSPFLGNNDPNEGYYCVRLSSSVNITFEKPHITQTPTVTDIWNDGCALLEAQVK